MSQALLLQLRLGSLAVTTHLEERRWELERIRKGILTLGDGWRTGSSEGCDGLCEMEGDEKAAREYLQELPWLARAALGIQAAACGVNWILNSLRNELGEYNKCHCGMDVKRVG